MLNILYGWYLKKELSCVFDTLTFTDTITANTTKDLVINDAEYGEMKGEKLTTFNYIITRLFTASTGGIPLEVVIQPDGDTIHGFSSIVLMPRVIEPEVSLMLTMDLKLNVINDTGSITDMFMVFEGFWIPKSLMTQFEELVNAIVTSTAKIDNQTLGTMETLENTYEAMRKQAISEGKGASYSSRKYPSRVPRPTTEKVPYCKSRRF